ncbi:hypothetical protein TNCT_359171, partial [Trichonephila clavata]
MPDQTNGLCLLPLKQQPNDLISHRNELPGFSFAMRDCMGVDRQVPVVNSF